MSNLYKSAILVLPTVFCLAGCADPKPDRPAAPSISSEAEKPRKESPVESAETPAERLKRVHFGSTVVDAHADTLGRILDDDVDIGGRLDDGHVDLVRAKEGGLDIVVFAVWVGPEYWPDKAKKRAVEMIDALHATVATHPDKMGFAPTVAAAEKLATDGKLAAFLGIEGGHAIEDNLEALKMFHDKGVRYMTLTWWNNTNWADGSGDKPKWHGLNELGKRVVQEMNRLGMVVDISHASDETFWDVLEVTKKPVIASHSNTRALFDHHRNLSDDMLRALAKNGGVVGVNYVAGFLDSEFAGRADALRAKLKPELDAIKKKHKGDPKKGRKERWKYYSEKMRELEPVPLDRVIDHIDHAVQVAGVNHVGLGSDFDGFSVGPKELTDCSKLPLITEKLLARGYSEADIKKILGGNFLRVFRQNIGE